MVVGGFVFLHFPSTEDESIIPLTQASLCKLKETAAKRQSCPMMIRFCYKFRMSLTKECLGIKEDVTSFVLSF